MDLTETILVQGAVENDVQILNDEIRTVQCSHGHTTRIAAGIVLGDKFNVMASNAKDMICPSCGETVNLL